MSDMKCPFCQQELERDYDKIQCPDINCRHKHDWYGSYDLWQELIRTRTALEIIKKEMSKETMPDFAVISDALKTALEQKDVK